MRTGFTLALLLAGALCASGAATGEPPSVSGDGAYTRIGTSAPAPVMPAIARLDCLGEAMQGGAIVCRTEANAVVTLDGKPVAAADATGLAVIGLSRGQSSPAIVALADPPDIPVPFARRSLSATVTVRERSDTVSRFPMDCGKIAPRSKADQRKAEMSWVKKADALKQFHEPVADLGFVKPAEGPYSSPFGVTRTYVPRTKDCEGTTSVHNGQDIAIPTGTSVTAPMGGTVILADPDLFFEGGCVFLDHGRGLVSVFMHLSRIDVQMGDVVMAGEQLGLSGATGRVTGPHLHWAIKFRNVTSDDRGTDIWLDPSLLLSLPAEPVFAEAEPLRPAAQ